MIILAVIKVLCIALIGAAAVVGIVGLLLPDAPTGYEDETGFHEENKP